MDSKNIVVIGCARSGLSVAKLAKSKGNRVTLYDKKEKTAFDSNIQREIEQLEGQGIQMQLGTDICLDEYERIIVSPGVPLDLPFIKDAIDTGKVIEGEFEYASLYCKSPIVAITGTNGKTTTTSLVAEIMNRANPKTFVVGNIGIAFSEQVEHITEDATTVAEVSSFQLETAYTFHPHVAALLNITPDHLNRHKTMENYVQAKYEITRNQIEEDFLVLNAKDEYCQKLARQTKAKVVFFHGESTLDYGVYQEGGQLYEKLGDTPHRICHISELKIVGKHNIENALAAIGICKAYGVSNEIIRQGLLSFMGVEHRVEYVSTKQGIDYYNDSKATNTDAGITGILSMSKPIRLIAGGMDKEVSFREWIAYFENRVKKVYVIGECRAQIIQECQEMNFHDVESFETFEEAIDCAVEEAQSGEAVLLSPACASWDMFESYEQRGNLFKERIRKMEG